MVEFHFLPVFQAHPRVVRVHAAKVDGRIAHGLELESFHRAAIGVQHFDFGIHRGAQLRGLRLNDPSLAGRGFEAKQIGIRLFAARTVQSSSRAHRG